MSESNVTFRMSKNEAAEMSVIACFSGFFIMYLYTELYQNGIGDEPALRCHAE